MGKKGLVILIVVVLIVVSIFSIGYFQRIDQTNRMIAKGCEPSTFDQFGIPTIWKCPPGVNPD